MMTAIKSIQKDSLFSLRKASDRPGNDKLIKRAKDRINRVRSRLLKGEQLTIEQISKDEKFSRSHCGNLLDSIAKEGLVEFVYINHMPKLVKTRIKLYKLKKDKIK